MSVHPRSWYYAKRYADCFLEFLNGFEKDNLSDFLRDDTFYESAIREGASTQRGSDDEESLMEKNGGGSESDSNSTPHSEVAQVLPDAPVASLTPAVRSGALRFCPWLRSSRFWCQTG